MILTACESARIDVSRDNSVATLEMLALSGCAKSDYDRLLALALGQDEGAASAALTALFYAGGIVGFWDRATPAIMGPERSRFVIAAPILALSIVRCADVTAFRLLMPIAAKPWDSDVLRAQATVRESFIDRDDCERLASGQLFERGLYLREQINGERFQSESLGRLLWYLRNFAGVPEVDEIFLSYLHNDYSEIALTALVGFGDVILSADELSAIPIRGDDALVRVANCASLLFRRTGRPEYLAFLDKISSTGLERERLNALVRWTIESAS